MYLLGSYMPAILVSLCNFPDYMIAVNWTILYSKELLHFIHMSKQIIRYRYRYISEACIPLEISFNALILQILKSRFDMVCGTRNVVTIITVENS